MRTALLASQTVTQENIDMAEDNDKLLTDDELSAIEDMVASGDLGGEGYNVGLAA
jgi:hypothetical protein